MVTPFPFPIRTCSPPASSESAPRRCNTSSPKPETSLKAAARSLPPKPARHSGAMRTKHLGRPNRAIIHPQLFSRCYPFIFDARMPVKDIFVERTPASRN